MEFLNDALARLTYLRDRTSYELFRDEFRFHLATYRSFLMVIAERNDLNGRLKSFYKVHEAFRHARNRSGTLYDWLVRENVITTAEEEYRVQELASDLLNGYKSIDDPGQLASRLEEDTLCDRKLVGPGLTEYAHSLDRETRDANNADPHYLDRWIADLEANIDPKCLVFFRAAMCCGAYGPRAFSGVNVAEVIAKCELSENLPISTTVDRILVYGCHLPANDQAQATWSRAGRSLHGMIARQVHGPLVWLQQMLHVKPLGQGRTKDQALQELVSQLHEKLVNGCDCWRKWRNFSIDFAVRGMYYCATSHALTGWDRHEDLNSFIYRSVSAYGYVDGNVKCNNFRKGMLAKVVQPSLSAGRVLRCKCRGDNGPCGNLIDQHDRCTSKNMPHELTSREIDYWLWQTGTFESRKAVKCGHCKQAFFSGTVPHWRSNKNGELICCPPNEEEHRWSTRESILWCYAQGNLLAANQAPAPGKPHRYDPARHSYFDQELCENSVTHAWTNHNERELARLLFCEGQSFPEAAENLRIDLFSARFERLLRNVFVTIADDEALPDLVANKLRHQLRNVRDEEQKVRIANHDRLRDALNKWWPKDQVQRLAHDLIGPDEISLSKLAQRLDLSTRSRHFTGLWLEAIFRWMLDQRLQRVIDIQRLVATWPDGQLKEFATKFFRAVPGDGVPNDQVQSIYNKYHSQFIQLQPNDLSSQKVVLASLLAECRQSFRIVNNNDAALEGEDADDEV